MIFGEVVTVDFTTACLLPAIVGYATAMTQCKGNVLVSGMTGQDRPFGLECECQVFLRSTIYPKPPAETNEVAARFDRTLKERAIYEVTCTCERPRSRTC